MTEYRELNQVSFVSVNGLKYGAGVLAKDVPITTLDEYQSLHSLVPVSHQVFLAVKNFLNDEKLGEYLSLMYDAEAPIFYLITRLGEDDIVLIYHGKEAILDEKVMTMVALKLNPSVFTRDLFVDVSPSLALQRNIWRFRPNDSSQL